MIPLPFLGEAALAGLLGATVGALGLIGVKTLLVGDLVASRTDFGADVSWTDLALIAPVGGGGGVLLPTLAAAWAMRRHLRT
jgi:cell division transport system permease protein